MLISIASVEVSGNATATATAQPPSQLTTAASAEGSSSLQENLRETGLLAVMPLRIHSFLVSQWRDQTAKKNRYQFTARGAAEFENREQKQ